MLPLAGGLEEVPFRQVPRDGHAAGLGVTLWEQGTRGSDPRWASEAPGELFQGQVHPERSDFPGLGWGWPWMCLHAPRGAGERLRAALAETSPLCVRHWHRVRTPGPGLQELLGQGTETGRHTVM